MIELHSGSRKTRNSATGTRGYCTTVSYRCAGHMLWNQQPSRTHFASFVSPSLCRSRDAGLHEHFALHHTGPHLVQGPSAGRRQRRKRAGRRSGGRAHADPLAHRLGQDAGRLLTSTDFAEPRPRAIRWRAPARISPLKALNNDIERPPAPCRRARGGGAWALSSRLRVVVRTGDTPRPPGHARGPPHILITTPESFYLILTSAKRQMLRTVRPVIVDDPHRGWQQARRAPGPLPEPNTWPRATSASAFGHPTAVEVVAHFLGGQGWVGARR